MLASHSTLPHASHALNHLIHKSALEGYYHPCFTLGQTKAPRGYGAPPRSQARSGWRQGRRPGTLQSHQGPGAGLEHSFIQEAVGWKTGGTEIGLETPSSWHWPPPPSTKQLWTSPCKIPSAGLWGGRWGPRGPQHDVGGGDEHTKYYCHYSWHHQPSYWGTPGRLLPCPSFLRSYY